MSSVEQQLLDALAERSRLNEQIRRATATARANAASVAPQDDTGVFTITTLATQEQP